VENYKIILKQGAQALDITLSDQQIELLLSYHALLIKWNKAYNLTSVRDPEQMLSRHLLDSLTIIPYLKGKRFLDVGAGAGLPGIVVAILFPEKTIELLDSNGKKTRFLFQVKTELQLNNIQIHQSRVETFQTKELFDGILSRAFATLADMTAASHHLLAEEGWFYAMKGQQPKEELSQLSKDYKVNHCHTLHLPGEDSQRHLLVLSRKNKH
jgi:16S rRNA (guanine527-N7)-methyltransferase